MKFSKNVSALNLKKRLTHLSVAVCLLMAPFIANAAPPDDPGAGNPDGVPFDSNMNLIFLAIGLAFATVVLVKQLQKRRAITNA